MLGYPPEHPLNIRYDNKRIYYGRAAISPNKTYTHLGTKFTRIAPTIDMIQCFYYRTTNSGLSEWKRYLQVMQHSQL